MIEQFEGNKYQDLAGQDEPSRSRSQNAHPSQKIFQKDEQAASAAKHYEEDQADSKKNQDDSGNVSVM